jgi:Mg/Co/Ni transporter MgtE
MSNYNLKLTIQFFKEEPVAAARMLDIMGFDSAAALLQKIPISVACKVIYAMLPRASANIIAKASTDFNKALFELIEVADIAAILRYVDVETQKSLIELLPKSRQALCKLLISYPENTVGTLIETNVLVVDSQMTVEEAMLRVRKQTYFDNHEVLIVNRKRKIVGKLSIFDLLRAPAVTLISALTNNKVDTVNGLSDVRTVLGMDIWQKTDSIAVVNRKQEFIGILRHYDLRAAIARNEDTTNLNRSLTGEVIDTYADVLRSISEIFIDAKSLKI